MFQLLELVTLLLAKKIGGRRSMRVLLQARLDYKYVPISMMSKLASARVLLWARLVNYFFMSKLLWALEQDLKKLLTTRKTLMNRDYLKSKMLVSVNLCLDCTVVFHQYHKCLHRGGWLEVVRSYTNAGEKYVTCKWVQIKPSCTSNITKSS